MKKPCPFNFRVLLKSVVLTLPFYLRNPTIQFWTIFRRIRKLVRSRLYKVFTLRSLKTEYQRIVNSPQRKICLIYDNSVSPPTYGDYLYIVFMARFLFYVGFSVELILTNRLYRQDWENLGSEEKKNLFVCEQISLARALGLPELPISIVDDDELNEFICSTSTSLILFEDRIKSKRAIYNVLFNFINVFYTKTYHAEFLLSSKTLREYLPINDLFSKPYVALHCRFNPLWGQDRNISDSVFTEILDTIRRKTKKPIVVVSDLIGCKHYKSLVTCDKSVSDVFFSKDFSHSFLGDSAIVLSSSCYLQFRGGGMGMIAMFSRTPYIICDTAVNEITFKGKNACSWATESQIRYFSSDFDIFKRLLEEADFFV